jgi:two-component system, NtrC family, response regulator GlrR
VTRPYAHVQRPSEMPAVRRFVLTVVEGPGAGAVWNSVSDACSIGSHPSNDFPLEDETVSRFHCEIRVGPRGARVRDLDSLNGIILDGVQVADGYLRGGSLLRLGRVVVRFDFSAESNRLPVSERTRLGSLVGESVAMRMSFALMERAAARDVTVLLEGETGTGKSQAAQAIHQESVRRDKPFLTVDCGAIPADLLESELFGHEKGAFTGAAGRRIGAFEEAHGGTVFLDEIGELPTELQPKLLRVLETREIRRVGTNTFLPVDVRIIAATNRDLRAEVNAGRFRSDLFFRLAVLRIPLPPVRQRPEDLPLLVEQTLSALGADPERTQALRTPAFFARLQQVAWPGNVRELRNYLERCLVFEDALALSDMAPSSSGAEVDPKQPHAEARRRALEDFERRYLKALLELHQGRVSQAAAAAGMDRVYLYRLLRRHGIKP